MTETTETTRWYYICDACGSIVTIEAAPIPEDQAWSCADCGSDAMWEFSNEAHALQHSRHIQQLVRSGLFHKR